MARILCNAILALKCARKSFNSARCSFRKTIFTLSRSDHEMSRPEKHQQSTGFTIMSANVAGLRAVVRQDGKRKAFETATRIVNPDVICIQEHKLQEIHVEDLAVRAL